ncbi:MAG: TlpA family protein disulfide reductase [Pseudomonadota bacterium]|nr:TlpA family protein disulfide reductase [Pseudomonadota bacterium]
MHKLVLALAGVLLMIATPARAQAAGEVGSSVQWQDVVLLDGRTLKASELRSNVVVVQIWASWCPFCAAQNPHVQKLHDAQAARGLTVLAFSIDQTEQAAKNYVAKRGYTFNIAMRNADVDRWFGRNRTLPETYVVDSSGKVVFVHRGEMFPEDIAALSRFTAK